MSANQVNLLKRTFGPAFATLLSRLCGLLRVMLSSRVIGGGDYASAWGLAFMIPNMFRRLLGEGALGQTLLPIVTHTAEKQGMAKMRSDLGTIFAALGLLLGIIVVTVSGLGILIRPFLTARYTILATRLLPILMPYCFFICLVGAAMAVANSRKSFTWPAMGALLLNFFLIGGLALGWFLHVRDIEKLLDALAVLVLISGLLYLVGMALLLRKLQAFPDFSSLKHGFNRAVLGDVWRLVTPGLVGGAALQISFFADRCFAASLGGQAVPALNYTDRIIDLPIGIFAVAFGQVLASEMSQAAAHEDFQRMRSDLFFSLRHVLFITVPMAFFVFGFRKEIQYLLLMGGRFTASDLEETCYATAFMAWGIPFFCAIKLVLPGFYARKKVKIPMMVSIVCCIANIIMNYLLMGPLRQGGLALATVLSAMLNLLVLLWFLRRDGIFIGWSRALLFPIVKIVASAALAWYLAELLLPGACNGRMMAFLRLGIGTTVFGAAYFGINLLLRAGEPAELFAMVRRRARPRR